MVKYNDKTLLETVIEVGGRAMASAQGPAFTLLNIICAFERSQMRARYAVTMNLVILCCVHLSDSEIVRARAFNKNEPQRSRVEGALSDLDLRSATASSIPDHLPLLLNDSRGSF